jgi:hypothetical protein
MLGATDELNGGIRVKSFERVGERSPAFLPEREFLLPGIPKPGHYYPGVFPLFAGVFFGPVSACRDGYRHSDLHR